MIYHVLLLRFAVNNICLIPHMFAILMQRYIYIYIYMRHKTAKSITNGNRRRSPFYHLMQKVNNVNFAVVETCRYKNCLKKSSLFSNNELFFRTDRRGWIGLHSVPVMSITPESRRAPYADKSNRLRHTSVCVRPFG